MLYLHPPYLMVNGVCCFADHADPRQFYFLPLGPHLTTDREPQTGKRIPRIQVIEYRGTAGTGGFLNFDVDLGIEQEALEEIRSEVKRLLRLKEPPLLAPVPLVDGTVKVMLFGKQSGDPAATPAPGERPQFVLKIDHHAKPALYGDNRAAFSVALDQAGVTTLKKALEGEMAPIGVVYSLDYLALRPAYSVRLQIDWDRVQTHFDESFGVNTFIFSSEINTAVDKLIDDRVIVLEADTFVPDEGEDASGIISRRDQALNEVREMMTNAFFEPSLDPVQDKEDGWDKAGDFLERLTSAGLRGGDGLFSYKKTDYTRVDRKTLNVNISERTTVKRTIYPQGHLSGLARVLRQDGLEPSAFMVSVDLDDPWFERRKVDVLSVANFAEDGIRAITVDADYGGSSKSVLLEPNKDRQAIEWPSVIAGGAMEKEVRYRYKVTFQDVDSAERPVSLQSPLLASRSDILEVVPRTLYSMVTVPIAAPSFEAKVGGTEQTLWDRYPQVEVRTRYEDAANGIAVDENFLLDKDHRDATWRFPALDPQRTAFRYQLVYRAADHKDVAMPWAETSEERILVRDPFPNKRTLTIVPSVSFDEVAHVFVDVAYEDPANGVRREESFEFSSPEARTFRVDLADPERRMVSYKVTILFKNGTLLEVPRSSTLQPRLIVRSDMKGHRIVRVAPEAVAFTARRLTQMAADLRFEDGGGSRIEEQLVFRSPAEKGHFEYDFADEQKAAFDYRVTYSYENGLSRTTDWAREAGTDLRLRVE